MKARQDVLRYLPHRPPFVMIDELSAEEGQSAHSRFTILADNILLEDGYFSAAGLVENMAQTAGVAIGITTQYAGYAPALGFIGAVKDLRVFGLPRIGQTLDTEVIFVHQVMQAHVVRGTARYDGQLLASCELKIFLQS